MCRDCAKDLRRAEDACSDPCVVRKMNGDQLTCPDSFQTELKKNEDGGDQPSSEDEEYNLAAIYAENSQGQEALGSYYVGPASMADQEIKDERNYNFRGVDDDDEYDLKRYFDDEPGAVLIYAKVIDNSIGEERLGWIIATGDELAHIENKQVNTDYTQAEFNETYGTKKIKRLFSKVVATKKPLHDGKGGQKQKIRICVCGNGEEGTQGHSDENRVEVPATFEMKTLLTLAEKEIGSWEHWT